MQKFIIAAALLAGTIGQANAQVVTKKYQVTASGFEAGAPIGTVKGIFEFTYNSGAFLTAPAPVTITNFNVPFAGTGLFSFNKMNDMLTVGNNISFNSYTVGPNTPGFGFFLKNLSTTPAIGSLVYSANGHLWHASSFSVTVPSASAVPETSAWAMMIGGLAAVGGVIRSARRRKVARQAFV